METNHSKTDLWIPQKCSGIPIDIDFEAEIDHSSILNTRHVFNKKDKATLSPSPTEVFSNNIPTRVNERADIIIIEMDEQTPDKYRAFFVYEDLFSRYVVLKPLQHVPDNDSVSEIVEKLVGIFSLIGAPKILQCSNGRKFAEKIVQGLRKTIPALEIVHGNILKKSSDYRNFKRLLEIWQEENPFKSWYKGLYFIQILENTSNFSTIKKEESNNSPSKIFFEQNINNELARFFTRQNLIDVVNEVWTEEELLGETIKYDIYENCTKNEFDAKPEFKISNKPKKTDNTEIIYNHNNNNNNNYEEAFKFYFKSKKSSIPSLRSMKKYINVNNKRENKKNIALMSNKEIKSLSETKKNLTNTKIHTFSEIEYYSCFVCDKIFISEKYLNFHMKNHDTTLKNQKKSSIDRLSKKKFIQSENNAGKVSKSSSKCLAINTEKKNNSDARDIIIEEMIPKNCSTDAILPLESQKTELKNKKEDANDTFLEKSSIQLVDDAEKITNSPSKSSTIDTKKKNNSDAKNETIAKRKPRHYAKRAKLFKKKKKSREETFLECKFCNKKFNFLSLLERHMRIHTNERPFICKICNKSFKQLGHLKQHAMSHIDYRSCQCPMCDEKFNSMNALKIHVKSHKDVNGQPSTIKVPYRLYECDICKNVFTAKSVMERHIYTHTNERQFSCDICGKKFKQSGHVKSHLLVHTGEKKFECKICPKRFSSLNALKKHEFLHTGNKPFQCHICGMRFIENRNLKAHLFTHTDEKPHVCNICGKKYTLAESLKRHISAIHVKGRAFQCEICAKMFKQLAHLNVHKKIHTDERPFHCDFCNKNFKHKNILKSHLTTHENFKPFRCDICYATFSRKNNLRMHILSSHLNERPYSCNICGKTFKQISHLNGHIIIHSNLLPYQCKLCEKKCNRMDNLKKHMKRHEKTINKSHVNIIDKSEICFI